jgi:hypothetical protein
MVRFQFCKADIDQRSAPINFSEAKMEFSAELRHRVWDDAPDRQ